MKQILKNIISVPSIWGGVIPLNLLGLFAIFNISSAPSWWWAATILGYILIMIVGVGAGNHKLFSHRAFETTRLRKIFILICSTLAAQGSALFWAGVHRGGHHRHSDTDKDPHSVKHGFWHAYILWQFKITEKEVAMRHIVDLLRDEDIVFFHKHYIKILWGINLIVALISINLWLYLLILPAFLAFHAFCLQTSVVHYRWAGYRNFQTKDNSVNVPWLFPFTQGECWHNNHHAEPWNANGGGKKWWELDPTYWIIKMLRVD